MIRCSSHLWSRTINCSSCLLHFHSFRQQGTLKNSHSYYKERAAQGDHNIVEKINKLIKNSFTWFVFCNVLLTVVYAGAMLSYVNLFMFSTKLRSPVEGTKLSVLRSGLRLMLEMLWDISYGGYSFNQGAKKVFTSLHSRTLRWYESHPRQYDKALVFHQWMY